LQLLAEEIQRLLTHPQISANHEYMQHKKKRYSEVEWTAFKLLLSLDTIITWKIHVDVR